MTTEHFSNVRAVLFDFGGVVSTSPFDAFAEYERTAGLPPGIIRKVNSTNSDGNAWALLERGAVDIDRFVELFEEEALAHGCTVDGRRVLGLISGDVRQEMIDAIQQIKVNGLVTACLTNNFRQSGRGDEVAAVLSLFDHVVESSVLGVRKPDPAFYERALDLIGVDASRAVFLDDLGINLKPARAMGMTTIKVVDAPSALDQLEALLGFSLRR